MKEIRLHGRGGLGTVKAAEILVYANVNEGRYGNSIPFFGFERQGAPVTSYVKLDDKPIKPKTQVYNPNCIIVLEPTIMNAVDVFDGLKENSFFILNSNKNPKNIEIPKQVKTIALVDATKIAQEVLQNKITNTIMLGAFAKATKWVKLDSIKERVKELFGVKNLEAIKQGYNKTKVYNLEGDRVEV